MFKYFCFLLCIYLLISLVYCTKVEKKAFSKYTEEELLGKKFEKKISRDFDLDPCKSGKKFFFLYFQKQKKI